MGGKGDGVTLSGPVEANRGKGVGAPVRVAGKTLEGDDRHTHTFPPLYEDIPPVQKWTGMWRPSRDRDKSRVSRGRSNVDNVNKQHVQTSPWRVGWLNARSPQAPSMKRSTTDVSMFLP